MEVPSQADMVQPIEERVAAKLKRSLLDISQQPTQPRTHLLVQASKTVGRHNFHRRLIRRTARNQSRVIRKSEVWLLLALFSIAAGGCGTGTGISSGPVPQQSQPAGVSPTPAASVAGSNEAKAASQLPRGGRAIFPEFRVVAFYGEAGVPNMGILGQGTPERQGALLAKRAALFTPFGRPVMPAFELIATVAQASPGASGCYCGRMDDETVRRYLDMARRLHGLLILDIQPGRSRFLPEAKRYQRFLEQPDVELAMDSEWRMGAQEVPGATIGHVNAAEINAVSEYLAGIVKRKQLPQKFLVVHQFAGYMVEDKRTVAKRAGLAITFHIDGFGGRALKVKTYRQLSDRDGHFFNGIKLFFDQDINMFSAREVMGLRPPPDLITYQ
ncbi:MAG: hypothetical protein DLM53_06010 [Candidatus Eremiobacter antarcticus]|nr:MAG: hypothetical protein DLM53_06010 [Candidatus Eremiobacter sp. RRmetagenome_bin22]